MSRYCITLATHAGRTVYDQRYTMAVVPSDLSNFIPEPFVLNTKKCGERARFSGDNSVLKRQGPKVMPGGCVAYTENPLPLGQVWQTTILDTITDNCGSGLVST